MIYDPQIHHRRSIRLKGFDYSQPGAYFVTMVTHDRACLFGNVVDSEMRMNASGEIAADCWRTIPNHFRNVELDAFIVMPNHVHGIIQITVGATHASPQQASPQQATPVPQISSAPPRGPKSRTIGAIVGSYKSAVTRQINRLRSTPGTVVWQRNYYEHVVRNEDEWNRIREYIAGNPVLWADDSENPKNPSILLPASCRVAHPAEPVILGCQRDAGNEGEIRSKSKDQNEKIFIVSPQSDSTFLLHFHFDIE